MELYLTPPTAKLCGIYWFVKNIVEKTFYGLYSVFIVFIVINMTAEVARLTIVPIIA